ncbi:MAG: efflux RND transporter periplasmic adaptor subunit [Microscillaceae bacterium]|jgi:RND family efflux transporter MFP subunit|nr:efflux RND transporter periplasmic adaptor subunit [Microscillaceae bacterium]
MKKYWQSIIWIGILGLVIFGITSTLLGNRAKQAELIQQSKVVNKVSFETLKISKKTIRQHLTTTGILTANQTLELLSETDGRITKIYFDLHDRVNAGQILAEVESDIKQTQVKLAELNYQKAQRDFARYEALHKNQNLSEYDLENARLQMQNAENQLIITKKQLQYTFIKSPIAGNITQKNIGLGNVLQLGTPLAKLTDISQLRLQVLLAPQDLAQVRVGTQVAIQVPTRQGENLQGFIKSIGVQSTEAGSFPIEIILQNNLQNPLLAGMNAQVIFAENESRSATMIPRSALVSEKDKWTVFVLENGKPIRKVVDLGEESGEEIEIIAGLREGETLIVKGQQNIK